MKKVVCSLLVLLVLLVLPACDGYKKTIEVDAYIDGFIGEHSAYYLSEDTFDYYFFKAMCLLDDIDYLELSDYIKQEDAIRIADSYNDDVTGLFKKAIIKSEYEVDLEEEKNKFSSLKNQDLNHWNYAYFVLTEDILNTNYELVDDVLNKINVFKEEDYWDADFASIAIMATAGKDVNKDVFYELIADNIKDDGVEAWGNVNACSTANVILGALAEENDVSIIDLVGNILSFKGDNSSFKNYSDGDIDLVFASPQAFAALAAYKCYTKTGERVSIF